LFDERLKEMFSASDVRYQQRFEAQAQAVSAAFQSQQQAMQTALAAAEKANAAALAAADRAVAKAEMAADKRFESVNEFRATLADQQRTLVPRAEVDVLFKALGEKVDTLNIQMEHLQAERAGVKGGWGYAVGAAGLMLTLFSLAMVLWKLKGLTP
jgi:hypothetical protein